MAVSYVEELPLIVGPAASRAGELTKAAIGQRYFEDDTGLTYRKSQDGLAWVAVATPVPGTSATSLGKAEDAAHASGDVGVMALTVRKDTAAATAGTDGDYQPPITDASGRTWVNDPVVGALIGEVQASPTANTVLDRLKALLTGVVLAAGTNLIGKVGIDQTTKGTTNAVDALAGTKAWTKASGEVAGNASATVFPTLACSWVKIKAEYNNAGRVYIGVSGVTKQDGSSDTTTGFELSPGEDTGWIPCANMSEFFRICDNAGDDVTYLALI